MLIGCISTKRSWVYHDFLQRWKHPIPLWFSINIPPSHRWQELMAAHQKPFSYFKDLFRAIVYTCARLTTWELSMAKNCRINALGKRQWWKTPILVVKHLLCGEIRLYDSTPLEYSTKQHKTCKHGIDDLVEGNQCFNHFALNHWTCWEHIVGSNPYSTPVKLQWLQ